MRTKFWILPISAVTLGLAAVALFYSKSVPAAPFVTWNPASIAYTIAPGQTQTIPFSLTALDDLPSFMVRAVAPQAGLVQVNPATTMTAQKGQTIPLTLTISIPASARPAVIPAKINLVFAASPNGQAEMLPAQIDVALPPGGDPATWPKFSDPTAGVSFSYPLFGQSGTVVDDSDSTELAYDVVLGGPNVPSGKQYSVVITPNTNYQSITAWFESTIDTDGMLSSAGSLQVSSLSNGMQVLLVGEEPPSFDSGPISGIYAMSASKKWIVTVETSNDSTIPIPDSGMTPFYLALLASMQLP